MTAFVESPWPAVAVCTVLLFVCGTIFLRTGRASVVAAMVAVVAAMAGLIVIEQKIVTDKEEVEDTLHGIAENLEANNLPEVLASFAPSCPGINRARAALNQVTVQSATVGRDLDVRINQLTSPPTATAYFTGRLQAQDKRGVVPYDNFIRKFKVRLERHDDRWLIADYEDNDLRSRIP